MENFIFLCSGIFKYRVREYPNTIREKQPISKAYFVETVFFSLLQTRLLNFKYITAPNVT